MSQTFWVPGTWSATLNSVVPQRIFQVQRWKWNLFEAFHRVLPPCFLHLQVFPRCSYRCLLFQQTGISMFYIGNQKHVDFLHLSLLKQLKHASNHGFPKAFSIAPPEPRHLHPQPPSKHLWLSPPGPRSQPHGPPHPTPRWGRTRTTTGKGTVPQNHGITIDYNLLRDHWATQNTIT